ncbi:MAG: DUF1566 domain-containing protein [Gammaproteobacteria bacterium]|nr:DUF1566 domain-containing protein [Gammaproteobacteria bacterium]
MNTLYKQTLLHSMLCLLLLACFASARAAGPFQDHGDGTVTDEATGLMWQQQDDGTERPWEDAQTYCEGLTLAGHDDWRLPEIAELSALVDYDLAEPAIDTMAFPDTHDGYWSNSTYIRNRNSAWAVWFAIGDMVTIPKDISYYIRCVRGEPVSLDHLLINGSDTVADTSANLVWQRTDDGISRTWEEAQTYCNDLMLAGYDDWRLPVIDELKRIIDYNQSAPFADTTLFPGMQASQYWSRSTFINDSTAAWYVAFWNEPDYYHRVVFMYDKSDAKYVRCVRSSISATPNIGFTPLTVQFSASISGDLAPYTYTWDFGDGTAADMANPEHTYNDAGNYTAILTVTDSMGDSLSESVSITTADPATYVALSDLNLSATPDTGLIPLTVPFSANVSGGLAPYIYRWDFGDGTTVNTANPEHTYNHADNYTVTLTVTDIMEKSLSGDVSINAFHPLGNGFYPFNHPIFFDTPNTGFIPLTVQFFTHISGGLAPYTYSWDFGDGTADNTTNPEHTYNDAGDYTVTFTVTDSMEESLSESFSITAADLATHVPLSDLNISATPDIGPAPLTVPFSASFSGGLAPYTYRLDFGDGTSAAAGRYSGDDATADTNIDHTYGAGDYTATLTVTDIMGESLRESVNISAFYPLNDLNIFAAPNSSFIPLTVPFSASFSGGLAPYTYSWDFGNGVAADTENPEYTYNDAGSYIVTFTVTDSMGDSLTESASISTADPATYVPLSDLNISATPNSGSALLTIQFSANVSGGIGHTYTWDFGDGATTDTANPVHTYDAGNYIATLTVTDIMGNSLSKSVPVAIEERFQDHGDGTVTDRVTALMWQQQNDDMRKNWEDAQTYCEGLTLAGHSDWRLPSIGELNSLADYRLSYPAIDTSAFPSVQLSTGRYHGYSFWSDSTYVDFPNQAWGVDFFYGNMDLLDKTRTGYIWCVRGEPELFNRFINLVISDAETVTDTSDGLVWQRVDDEMEFTWENASAYCEKLVLDGKSDWRQPLIDELKRLLDYGQSHPAADTAIFPEMRSSYYWSDSSYVNDPGQAWGVNFDNGFVLTYNKGSTGYVRCVRGGAGSFDPLNDLSISATPNNGFAPLTMQFSASFSSGLAPHAFWDFGDGTVAGTANPEHTYNAGSYIVTFTVTDMTGKSLSELVSISAANPETFIPLNDLNISATPNSGFAPLTVQFSASVSGGFGHTYAWEFSDGGTADTANPAHTFNEGDYTATLAVTDTIMGDSLNKRVPVAIKVEEHFQDRGDGTVTDRATALMWQQQDDGIRKNWEDAQTYCKGLALAGYDDWRLPEAGELSTLVDDRLFEPAIDTSAFFGARSSYYWSGSTDVRNLNDAWNVNFSNGFVYVNNKDNINYVRCVRGDPELLNYVDYLVINNTETVADTLTGLVWQRKDDGIQRSWQNARSYCNNLSLAGHDDWRLPAIDELKRIIDYGQPGPSADITIFSGVRSSHYWSGSTYVADLDDAWIAHFDSGDVFAYDKTDTYYVRCVREEPASFGHLNISATPASGPAPLSVGFSASVSGGFSPYTHAWYFGDGGVAHTANPIHAYYDPGRYTAALTVTDSIGARQTESVSILVDQAARTGLFQDHGDSTITDKATALMWQQQDDGLKRNWEEAQTYCEGLTLAGHGDWRLPEIGELSTLVDYGLADPNIDTTVFIGARSSNYWSDSTDVNNPDLVRFVDFDNGGMGVSGKGATYYVRCVRGGSGSFDPLNYLVISGVDTVTDTAWRLVWQREDDGIERSWEGAGSYCGNLSLAGHDDWRLPVIDELKRIMDYGQHASVADITIFPGIRSSNYWSGSTNVASPGTAWYVSFYSGGGVDSTGKTATQYVRCVREGSGSFDPLNPLNISATPASGFAPLTVRFSSASVSGGFEPYIEWDLGDGGTAHTANPTHTYYNPGSYAVALTVTDPMVDDRTEQLNIHVEQAPRTGAFQDHDNGTVTDEIPALMWQQQDDGVQRNRLDAHNYCENLRLAGYENWRLPTIGELGSLVDYRRYDPAIDTNAFPGAKPSVYWSGSSDVIGLAGASWHVHFRDGDVDRSYDDTACYVRCVRAEIGDSLKHLVTDADTVTDTERGLMWQREDDGIPRSREDAYCDRLNLAGYDDWRLPLIDELKRIIDHEKYSPAADTGIFPGMRPSPYWSGSTYVHDPNYAWTVDFDSGNVSVNDKQALRYKRCVRTGSRIAGPLASLTISAAPDSGGTAPVTIDFSVSVSGGLEPYNYIWNFGDSGWASTASPGHTYAEAGRYKVTVSVTDAMGDRQKSSMIIRVNASPSAKFTAAPLSGDAPLTVILDAAASADPVGTVTRYDWSGSEGQTASGASAALTFNTGGTHTIFLAVTDNDGAQNSVTQTVEVNAPPVAAFSVTPDFVGAAPFTVVLDAGASADPDGNITDYLWSSSDGQTTSVSAGSSSDAKAVFVFDTAGTYRITLTVTDDKGTTGAFSRSVTVLEDTASPGLAIILAAGSDWSGNSLFPYTHELTQRMYRLLKRRGFGDRDIQYMSPRPPDIDLDGLADDGIKDENRQDFNLSRPYDELNTAFAEIARLEKNQQFVFYVHGHAGWDQRGLVQIKISRADPLSAEYLLELLEQAPPDIQQIIILDTPYSGSFANELAGVKNRIVITSANDSPSQHWDIRHGGFSDLFIREMHRGKTLGQAFSAVSEMIVKHPDGLFGNQQPWLNDGVAAAETFLGQPDVPAITLPQIAEVHPSVTLPDKNSEASVWVRVNPSQDAIHKVTAVMRTPGGVRLYEGETTDFDRREIELLYNRTKDRYERVLQGSCILSYQAQTTDGLRSDLAGGEINTLNLQGCSQTKMRVATTLNRTEYTTGDNLQLSAYVSSGEEGTADLYAGLLLPNGNIVPYHGNGIGFGVAGDKPSFYRQGISGDQLYSIFEVNVPDSWVSGRYQACAGLVNAGEAPMEPANLIDLGCSVFRVGNLHSSYDADAETLNIPEISMPDSSAVYRAGFVLLSDRLPETVFELVPGSIQEVNNPSGFSRASFDPGTGIVDFRLDVRRTDGSGVDTYAVQLELIPGTSPAQFRLKKAVRKN